jgi:recombination protein RecT
MSNESPNPLAIISKSILQPGYQNLIKQVLPSDLSADKFTAATLEALKRSPKVFEECDRQSVYNAIVDAARDGLVPDGKQGALVPFSSKSGKRCQWLIMPQGIQDKLAKQGVSIYAVSVYANDDIVIWNDDTGQHVRHEPEVFGDRGEFVGSFACARTKENRTYIEALSVNDIARVRAVSKQQKDDGPWVVWFERMAEKSALHRLARRLPNVHLEDDEEFKEALKPAVVIDPAPEAPRPTRPKALQAVIDSTPEPTPPEPSVSEPRPSEPL